VLFGGLCVCGSRNEKRKVRHCGALYAPHEKKKTTPQSDYGPGDTKEGGVGGKGGLLDGGKE